MGLFASCYGELTSKWKRGLMVLTLFSASLSIVVGVIILATCALDECLI